MSINNMENTSKNRMTNKQRKVINTIFVIIILLVFAGVNVLANFLVNKFPSLEADMTSDGSYSIQKTTEEYLEYLDTEINLRVLMEEEQLLSVDSAYGYQVNQLLRDMSLNKNINLEYVDVTAISVSSLSEKYPDIDWTNGYNLIIVEDANTGKYECLGMYDVFYASYDSSYNIVISGQYLEQEVLSGIQKITADKIIKVALTTGNGEFFNENSDFSSYCSYLPVVLDDNAYEVEYLNLLTQTPSEDTDIIIMMAPSVDLTSEAVDALSQWLNNSGDYGKTLFYVPYDNGEEDMTNLDLFLEQWGLAVGEGYINETDLTRGLSMMGDSSRLYPMTSYGDDTYTEGLSDKSLSVLMPYCMPVEILDSSMATPLLTSSDMAQILIPPVDSDSEIEYIDNDGEALNAAAISTKTNDDDASSNVIVWGSYDGLSNDWLYSSYSSNFNNSAYFVSILNTLTDNEAVILVESVDLSIDTLAVTNLQQVMIFIFFVVLIPVGVVVTGLVIWVRRRNR